MQTTIDRNRHARKMDTQVSNEFTRPATALEKSNEYEEFSSVKEAAAWLEGAAKLFGEVHSSGSHQTLNGQFHNFKEVDRATTQISNRLRAHGINAQYGIDKHVRHKRHKKGGLIEDELHGEASWSSALSLTDGPGTTGGIYAFRSHGAYSQSVPNRHANPEPSTGDYEISYLTEDDSGYGFETSAKYVIGGEGDSAMSAEDQVRFLNLASHFRSVLISKLAILDGADYKRLEQIVDYAG